MAEPNGTPAARRFAVERRTDETGVRVNLNLDGEGRSRLRTGNGFFEHMLDQLARHAGWDLEVDADGDLRVDLHHLVEDVGITLGQAIAGALGDRAGLVRFGFALVPMDECLARAAVDLSGRSYLVLRAAFPTLRTGDFDVQLVREFFRAFADHGRLTLHLAVEYGENTHHEVEALFKAAARALRQASDRDPRVRGVPSTKGVLV